MRGTVLASRSVSITHSPSSASVAALDRLSTASVRSTVVRRRASANRVCRAERAQAGRLLGDWSRACRAGAKLLREAATSTTTMPSSARPRAGLVVGLLGSS